MQSKSTSRNLQITLHLLILIACHARKHAMLGGADLSFGNRRGPKIDICGGGGFQFSYSSASVLFLVIEALFSFDLVYSFAWCSSVLFSYAVLAGSLLSLPTRSLMILPLPLSKTNTSNKAWGDAVRWLRVRQMWSLSYPGMRASPSTCRVLTIN